MNDELFCCEGTVDAVVSPRIDRLGVGVRAHGLVRESGCQRSEIEAIAHLCLIDQLARDDRQCERNLLHRFVALARGYDHRIEPDVVGIVIPVSNARSLIDPAPDALPAATHEASGTISELKVMPTCEMS